MKLFSSGIVNGIIEEKYGARGSQMNENGIPTLSLPLQIIDAPANAKSFAFVLEDKDAIPVSNGFVWIHWVAANITHKELLENASQEDQNFLQGLNSWTSIQGGEQSKELSSFYGGMCPPDKTHMYEWHVFALDTLLDLKDGFYMNEMFHAMRGHVLDDAVLYGTYANT